MTTGNDRRNLLALPAPPEGLTRRGFLGLVVAGVAAACSDGGDSASTTTGAAGTASTTSTSLPVPELPANPFTLGVASGDPVADGVVLWTRLAPAPLEGGGMPDQQVPVQWAVYADDADPYSDDPVLEGTAVADPAFGHSVHVEVAGLDPDTWYRYAFRVGEWSSASARTRTAPAPDATPDRLRFAFASCQNWEDGRFTPYPHLVADEPDLVLFLGDYIYEYAGHADGNPPSGRSHDLVEIETIEQYRNRYGLYKGDADLQAAHAACPWIVTWDDHEVENNYAGQFDENGSPPEEFLVRRAAAYQAYYEHMPIRVEAPEDADLPIYRSVPWGTLAEILVLDTRQYRSDQVCGIESLGGDVGPPCDDMQEDAHVLLGREQEEWLHDRLLATEATWKVLANQMVFAQMPIATVYNLDQWDGYPNDRTRLLHLLSKSQIRNVVVVTGDIHASGAAEVFEDPEAEGAEPVAVELVGTSISSDSGDQLATVAGVIEDLPWVQFVDVVHRGYGLCTVSPEELRADFRYVETALEPESPLTEGRSYVVRAGSSRLSPATA